MKQKKKEEFQTPEAAEMMNLAETKHLYKSNLFRLQLDELIAEVSPVSTKVLEQFLHNLRKELKTLEPREFGEDYSVAFPDMKFRQYSKYPFAFQAPTKASVVGSFLLQTCTKPQLNVDVALEIPKDTLWYKDYLNARYLDKRTAYVAELHRQLQKKNLAVEDCKVEMALESWSNNIYKPVVVLKVTLPGKKADTWNVRLIPVPPADLFAVKNLAANRNAVRTTGGEERTEKPTPAYNMCILEDLRMAEHLALLDGVCQKFTSFRDCVRMLKVWGHQRGFLHSSSRQYTGMNGFFFSMVAAHVCTSMMLATHTSSNQMFKLCMVFLADTDFTNNKVTFGQPMAMPMSAEEKSLFRMHFYDKEGLLNFAWRCGPSMAELRHEAKRSIALLESQEDAFEAMFGTRHRVDLAWDLHLHFKTLPHTDLTDAVDSASNYADKIIKVLEEGMGDRMQRYAVRYWSHDWTSAAPAESSLSIGITLNTMTANRTLDKGPSASDKEASLAFRKIWGAKAELRRFKDGSILECCGWEKPMRKGPQAVFQDGADSVASQVVSYLLKSKFPALDGAYAFHPLGCASSDDLNRELWLNFDEMRKHITSLSSLPLAIKEITPVDAAFSYSEMALRWVQDGNVKRSIHDVVIEFESSGAWPKDSTAIAKVKTALFLKIQDELSTDLGIESEITEEYLDIKYPQQLFRCRIVHPAELIGYAAYMTNFNAILKERPDGAALRDFWWKPMIRRKLHALTLQQPALAPAMRLVKFWASSHLLGGFEDLLEHLMAFCFLSPGAYDVPSTPHIALGRFFHLLATFEWSKHPLILDLDGEMTGEERHAIQLSYERARSMDVEMPPMWVTSRFDPHALFVEVPIAHICSGLVRLGKNALDLFHQRTMSLRENKAWKPLFTPNLSMFDAVIHLTKTSKKGPVTQAEVERYVSSLRVHFSKQAVFFQSESLGVVGVKFRPTAFLPQAKRALLGSTPHLVVQDLVIPNVLFMTASFTTLGNGIVTKVDVH